MDLNTKENEMTIFDILTNPISLYIFCPNYLQYQKMNSLEYLQISTLLDFIKFCSQMINSFHNNNIRIDQKLIRYIINNYDIYIFVDDITEQFSDRLNNDDEENLAIDLASDIVSG
uniref:Uncharacterized protein n=1 Tax=Onchocerca volvulus TaxID=6282 RepID=A0A8R1TRT8_ONCVO